MCLAFPGKIDKITDKKKAVVDFGGIKRTIALDLLPQSKKEDYVLVHSGYAITILDKKEALTSIKLLRQTYGIDRIE